jgi:RES domain-containing protein
MIVYRLARAQFCQDLSGRGAEITGGRWNSKGTSLVYTSSSRALCVTEIAVHMPLGVIPEDYFLITIQLPPDATVKEYNETRLPSLWNSFPHGNATQMIGDQFVREDKYLVLKVPSAVVQGDYNYLLNPRHKMMNKVRIKEVEAFRFDERLFIK